MNFCRSSILPILLALGCVAFTGCGAGSKPAGNAVSPADSSSPGAIFSVSSLVFSSQLLNSTSPAQTVTLTNTGNASLSLAGMSVTGDFAQTNACPSSLPAGASCTVSVTFTPAAVGTRTGTLTVTDNAAASPQQVSLSGTGAAAATPAAAAVTLSPSSLTFASQTVATTSTAQTITLKNTGAGALSISGLVPSGNFGATTTCPSSLPAGASCTISVTFTPTAAGTLTGAITFTDNAAASPQQVSLSGTGAAAATPAAPAVTLSPSSLTFASQTVATTSAAQTVTLKNSGTGSLSISGIAASGNFAETNTCGTNLAASASCTISVTFTPTAAGTPTGAITFTDNAAASPQAVSLSGTSTAALAITTTSLPAGVVGTAYSTTLAATGGVAPYTWTDSPCSGACNTGMGFSTAGVLAGTPVNAGSSTFTMTVTDSAGHTAATPLTITIAAAAAPAVSISPTSLTFASQTVATTSAAQTVTLKNSGSGSLSIGGIAASGNFAETTACPSSLPAGASCTLSVTFTPTAAGTLTGAITFADNAAASPQQVSLSGTAVATGAPAVSFSPASLTFSSQVLNSTSEADTVTLTNTGNASLSLASVHTSGAFAETNNCGTAVAAGASCIMSVTFTPTSAGSLSGSLSFADNAAGSPQSVSLYGTGVSAGALSENQASVSFGTVTVGQTSSQTLTITNTGGENVIVSAASTSGAGVALSGISVPLTLAPGKSSSFTTTFSPTSTGAVSGTITLTNNSPTPSVAIPVTGTGAAASAAPQVVLTWGESSTSVAGYNTYRGTVPGGPYTKLTASPVAQTSYTDSGVQAGSTYFYVVTAVGTNGVESGYSSQVEAVVPTT